MLINQGGDLLKKLFSLIPRKRIIFDFGFSVLWSLIECYFVTILAQLTGKLLGGTSDLIKMSIFFLIFIFFWEVLEFIGDVHADQTLVRIENILNKAYLDKMNEINPAILKENNTGYVSGLLNKLIDTKKEAYQTITMYMPIGLCYIVYFGVSLLQYHWAFSLELIFICTICIIIKVLTRKLANEKIMEYIEASSVRNKVQLDTLININTVQKMQAKDFFLEKFETYGNNTLIKNRIAMEATEFSLCSFKFVGMLFAPISLIIYLLIPTGTINDTAAFASLIAMLTVKLVHTIKGISQAFIRYDKFTTAYQKFTSIINDSNKRTEISKTSDFNTIELRDVDYSYNRCNEGEDKLIHIKIPNFTVNKGEIICIHGESGQGKTTLLSLLSQEIINNNVYIDGKLERDRIDCVFISQDTEMFDMTLKENLTLGKDIPEEKLLYYLEQTGLKEWFDKQKDGFNTIIGERGVFVSTGQRQRLNLIRGLLTQDKEIYLLDEPTSNVDEETECKMINLIKEAIGDKTVVIVTHRPKIMEICDRTYLFKDSVLYEEYCKQ